MSRSLLCARSRRRVGRATRARSSTMASSRRRRCRPERRAARARGSRRCSKGCHTPSAGELCRRGRFLRGASVAAWVHKKFGRKHETPAGCALRRRPLRAARARCRSDQDHCSVRGRGPVDALARILANELAPRLQTDVVVENRGGAGGLLAVDLVARAPADGRTILFGSVGAFVITNALKPQPGYEQLKVFAPVARVGAAPTLFIVKADSSLKSLNDLIAKAKRGDKVAYGSAGVGTTMHIAAEQLNAAAGTKITHVPY